MEETVRTLGLHKELAYWEFEKNKWKYVLIELQECLGFFLLFSKVEQKT
jgi:hypothetical protein